MKFVQLLLEIVVIRQCFADETHGLDVSLFDIYRSARDIAAGLAQAYGNQLTADYYFRYTTNVVLGFPSVRRTAVVNALCE